MELGDHFDSSQFIARIWNTLLEEVMFAKQLQGLKG